MTTETRGRLRIEPTTKRLRAVLGDTTVFDTVRALLVWEGPHFPVYYVPAEDVAEGVLVPSDHSERSPSRGVARFWSVRGGGRVARDAARQYASPRPRQDSSRAGTPDVSSTATANTELTPVSAARGWTRSRSALV
jgi:uncharacterized protein (DUF427 family)